MVRLVTFHSEKTGRAKRHEEIKARFFADFADQTWDRRKEKGFCTIPRTLGLVMTLLNHLSKRQDLSRVYFELWCRAFDEGVVDVIDEESIAYASGYTTPTRNVRSWRERISTLEKLGFIKTRHVGSRKFRYILILHPHRVIETLRGEDRISEEWYSAYLNRMTDIGGEVPRMEEASAEVSG